MHLNNLNMCYIGKNPKTSKFYRNLTSFLCSNFFSPVLSRPPYREMVVPQPFTSICSFVLLLLSIIPSSTASFLLLFVVRFYNFLALPLCVSSCPLPLYRHIPPFISSTPIPPSILRQRCAQMCVWCRGCIIKLHFNLSFNFSSSPRARFIPPPKHRADTASAEAFCRDVFFSASNNNNAPHRIRNTLWNTQRKRDVVVENDGIRTHFGTKNLLTTTCNVVLTPSSSSSKRSSARVFSTMCFPLLLLFLWQKPERSKEERTNVYDDAQAPYLFN